MSENAKGQIGLSRPEWIAFDHVQVAIPVGAEETARQWYGRLLGFVEVPKPPALAARGGCWFEGGGIRLHLGADANFVPARKAHPALTIRRLRSFVDDRELDVQWDGEIPGIVRCHVDDPFGNRIELIEA